MPDLSFLPDQPAVDTSFLPDKPGDTSFLPDQPKKPLFEAKTSMQEAGLQAATRFISTAGFDIPKYMAGRMGYEIPTPETAAGRIGAGVGTLGGFVTGGPIRAGAKVGTKLIAKLAPRLMGKAALLTPIIKHATTMGVASALMTPEEGLFAPEERIKGFGSGVVHGSIFGGLSYIPSTPARMFATSGYMGLPSTLREEPLETQIFNYGLGAWFGRKGISAKTILDHQKMVEELTAKGHSGKNFEALYNAAQSEINDLKKYVKAKGRQFKSETEMLNYVAGKGKPFDYEFDPAGNFKPYLKVWHKGQMEQRLWNKIKELKPLPETAIRNDDVSFIVGKLKTKKSFANYTDKQLQGFLNILTQPPQAPAVTTLQPENAQPLNAWDMSLRPNYAVMKKSGFGDFSQAGLTNTLFTKDSQMAVDFLKHAKLLNFWKLAVGTKAETSEAMAMWLDGKVSSKYIKTNYGVKTLKVAGQIRQYYDLLLSGMNRHRARYGLGPVKPKANYYTHIFDTIQQELSNPNKYHLPYDILEAMKYIVPKEKYMPYLQKRLGKKGYIYDIWKALDIYSMRATYSMNDSFIRDANRYMRFVGRSLKDPNVPEETKAGLWRAKKYLGNFVEQYTSRPGYLDNAFRQSMRGFNTILHKAGMPEHAVLTISEMSNFLTSAIYATQMAYRPKLAIRNLGQHSLIIGQTGFKPLIKALSIKRTPEVLNILSKSKVIQSRAHAFAPEIGRVAQFIKSGMWMYRKADIKNVVDAYLAGYYQAKGQGLSETQAVRRGDQVAGLTQYIYLKGNRSALGRGWGLSSTLGRPMSVFTTWPANYIEFLIASSAPEYRANLVKYLATGTGVMALAALGGVKGAQYVGFTSPFSLWNMLKKGQLPVSGITERLSLTKPETWSPQVFRDIKKAMEGDVSDMLFYTFKEEE